jgi:hypothetical protein
MTLVVGVVHQNMYFVWQNIFKLSLIKEAKVDYTLFEALRHDKTFDYNLYYECELAKEQITMV